MKYERPYSQREFFQKQNHSEIKMWIFRKKFVNGNVMFQVKFIDLEAI